MISMILGTLTVIALLLIVGALIHLKWTETISERTISRRIKAEYPVEVQAQVYQTYQHMKVKELEGLFLKILDDANGDVLKVQKLASIAESVSWRAFLENHW